jgi:subfamily B ATP-binding cassette protein HlyB/CyaB
VSKQGSAAAQARPGEGAAPAGGDWELLGAFVQLIGLRADVASLKQHFAARAARVTLQDALEVLRGLGQAPTLVRGGAARLPATGPVLARAADERLMIVARGKDGAFVAQLAGDPQTRRLDAPALESLWSGEWLLAKYALPAGHHDEGQAGHAFGVGWFWTSLRKYKGLMGEVLLASFFVQVFALLTPLIFQVVIDKVLTHRTLSTLDVMVIALAGVSLFEVVLGALRHYLFSHTTHRVDVELGARLFRHLLHLPLSYFESRRAGDTVARVRELENARSFLTGQALTSWLDLFFALLFLAVMFYYSVTLSLIVVAALPVFFLSSWLLTPLLRSRLEDKFALGAENQAFLAETVGSMETLKSHAVERSWQREWDQRLASYVHSAFEAGKLGQATQQFIGLVGKALTVALLYFGAKLVIAGELTVGGLIAFNMLSGRVNAPILKLASLWQDFAQMKVSVRRLADIMDAPAEPAFRPGRAAPPALRGRITFQDMTFRYAPGAPEVLCDLSLDIQPGEIVGITGISGAGKTTLMRLVQRLYTPEKGRILLDGMDLGAVDTGWLRRQIGVVGQDALLFNRTVRDNIALGDPGLPMERVMDSARLAGAHDFVMQLPDGYDTLVGERGSRLSGGQRARIAIARALAIDPRVLLLDEATAALDYESERIVHDHMAQICRGRTVLIVAHRLSTLRLASRVLVLDRGRLVETGSHAELMQRNGRYQALYRAHQILEAA